MSEHNRDEVIIKGLTLEASIGVYDWEKQIKQTLEFDITLMTDFSKASCSDAIEDAIDYAAVCQRVEEIVNSQHYQLLEYLAEKLSTALLTEFQVSKLCLSIMKPGAVPKARNVGVSITRIANV